MNPMYQHSRYRQKRTGIVSPASVHTRLLLLPLAATIVVALLVMFLPANAGAAEYLLGSQDKVRLKVYEWRASRDEFFEWKALNDDFIVAADGTLSLPFAGKIMAEGLEPTELAEKVSSALLLRMDLGRRPDVSAEIVEYRPFYITGDVQEPGEFPFRPGLTVLQAVSIGGGLRRDKDASRIEREIISGRGELAMQQVTRDGLLARKARLESEVRGDESIVYPNELAERSDQREIAVVMDQERAIFDARQQGFETQLRALEELRDFLERAAGSLEAHLQFQDQQVALAQKEMENVAALVKKGFVAETRRMDVERALVRAQSDRLTAESSLMRARQEKSRTEISIIELDIDRKNQVRAQLRETEEKLEELALESATTAQLLRESESLTPAATARLSSGENIDPVYTIVRSNGDGTSERLEVGASNPVLPGDVVEVAIPLDDDSQAFRQTGFAPAKDLSLEASTQKPQQTTFR